MATTKRQQNTLGNEGLCLQPISKRLRGNAELTNFESLGKFLINFLIIFVHDLIKVTELFWMRTKIQLKLFLINIFVN